MKTNLTMLSHCIRIFARFHLIGMLLGAEKHFELIPCNLIVLIKFYLIQFLFELDKYFVNFISEGVFADQHNQLISTAGWW